jgi:hypothetical protein
MQPLPSTLTVDTGRTNAEIHRALGEQTHYQPEEMGMITNWGASIWVVQASDTTFRIIPRTTPSAGTWTAFILMAIATVALCVIALFWSMRFGLLVCFMMWIMSGVLLGLLWSSTWARKGDPPLVEFSKSTGEVLVRGWDAPVPVKAFIRIELVSVLHGDLGGESFRMPQIAACIRRGPTQVQWLAISDRWCGGATSAAIALSRALNVPLERTHARARAANPRSPKPWLCATCGYDLRGITSQVCPECGTISSRGQA